MCYGNVCIQRDHDLILYNVNDAKTETRKTVI